MKRRIYGVALAVILGMSFTVAAIATANNRSAENGSANNATPTAERGPLPADAETAVFAGGCFWCMEEAFEKAPGVYDAISGYAGGPESNPDYNSVAYGRTGHTEVVQVVYDPGVISYSQLLDVFWRNIDPLDANGQFCDRGASYRTGIFVTNEEQRQLATESRRVLDESGRFNIPIVTEITDLDVIPDDDNDGFWIAEDYHQDYYKTSTLRYELYKEACGRVRRLVALWGDEAGGPYDSE